jgi:hypothetical protein
MSKLLTKNFSINLLVVTQPGAIALALGDARSNGIIPENCIHFYRLF